MLAANLARYDPGADGAILHWLACGPHTTPLRDLSLVVPASGSPFGPGRRWCISNAPDSLELKAHAYRELVRPAWQPGPTPQVGQPGPVEGCSWQAVTAEADAIIDMSLFNFALSWMQGWLYTAVLTPEPARVEASLLTVNPVEVWLNRTQVLHHTRFGYVEPDVVTVALALNAGWNELWLYGVTIGWREARLALGLRLPRDGHISTGIPLGEITASDWLQAEQGLDRLVVAQGSFSGLALPVHLEAGAGQDFAFSAEIDLPVQDETLRLPAEADRYAAMATRSSHLLKPGEGAVIHITPDQAQGMAQLSNDFPLRLRLEASGSSRQSVERALWGRGGVFHAHAPEPGSGYDTCRQEALEHLSQMTYRVYGAMAAVRLGRSQQISPGAVDFACQFLERRYDCADFYAVDLLSLLCMFDGSPALRPQDRQRIESAFLNFKYWIDEPGLDAMCYHTENHQILFHVTAYLAGQRWPDWTFTNSGLTGGQQYRRARQRIDAWISSRLRGSFSEWDSSSYLALDAFALLALVEFGDSAALRKKATALLNKIFFSLACHSFRGVHGSTHGRSYVAQLKSARVENISGLQRIAWGLGALNGESQAAGLLAFARRYRVPELIQKIGADLPEALLTQARSSGRYRPQFDLQRGDWEVNTLTWRTPDGMLSAAVDYQPGIWGWQEHIWQATLSPEAIVFTNQPGNSQEHGNARPNFWAGSARLPRAAMHENTVVCIYDLSLPGGLPFTHAYFPAAAFDEYRISARWAMARVGNGYLALGSDGDLQLTSSGRHAGQELRSLGPGQIWLAHLGRAAEYGCFDAFCREIAHSAFHTNGLQADWTAPSGQHLEFSWQGPFLVNDTIQALGDFPHFANRYTHTPHQAAQMRIEHAGEELTLNLR